MTDEQKIIDGVDVSGCNFCDGKSSDIPQCRIRLASFETTCKGYNCYYKQLKQAEKKIEKIEEKCKEYNFSTDIYDESDILAGEILQIIEDKANE